MALETEPVPQRSDAATRRSPGSALALTALADVAVILAFVLMGRNSHEERLSPASVLGVAAPFLIAAALSWAALVLWHRSNGGETAASFVIVTGAVLGVGLVGWRVAVGVRSNRAGS